MDIRIFQLHKKGAETFDKIEDKVNVNIANGAIAVSDGATQGYCSGLWANVVTAEFIDDPVFDPLAFVSRVLAPAAVKYNSQLLSLPVNPVLAKLIEDKKKQGGYGTFIGVQLQGNVLKTISVGDSNLFLLSGTHVQVFPHGSVEALNGSDDFINTEEIRQGVFNAGSLRNWDAPVKNGDELFIVTDAIARYLLQDIKRLGEVSKVATFAEYLAFAEKRWQEGALESDDLTVVRIKVTGDPVVNATAIVPPVGFTFKTETESAYNGGQANGQNKNRQGIPQGTSLKEQELERTLNDAHAEHAAQVNRMATALDIAKKSDKSMRGKFFGAMVLCMLLLAGMGTLSVFCVKYYKKANAAAANVTFLMMEVNRLTGTGAPTKTAELKAPSGSSNRSEASPARGIGQQRLAGGGGTADKKTDEKNKVDGQRKDHDAKTIVKVTVKKNRSGNTSGTAKKGTNGSNENAAARMQNVGQPPQGATGTTAPAEAMPVAAPGSGDIDYQGGDVKKF